MPGPPIDLLDFGSQLVLEVALPGVLETDIEIRIERSAVLVRAELGEEHGAYLAREIQRGSLVRRVELPYPVEMTHAAYEEGILRIRLTRLGGD